MQLLFANFLAFGFLFFMLFILCYSSRNMERLHIPIIPNRILTIMSVKQISTYDNCPMYITEYIKVVPYEDIKTPITIPFKNFFLYLKRFLKYLRKLFFNIINDIKEQINGKKITIIITNTSFIILTSIYPPINMTNFRIYFLMFLIISLYKYTVKFL